MLEFSRIARSIQSDTYRADIDGLRAVAVLSVVVCHAFPFLLPGGFIGVDVFLVISGYLISSIILSEVDAGQFSVVSFYERRIRRIFPALVATLLVTSLLAYSYLMPIELVARVSGRPWCGGTGVARYGGISRSCAVSA